MKELPRDLRWIVPASLGMGLILSHLGPGIWWIGWLTYTLVSGLGLAALAALWRSSGSSRTLGLMLLLAVVLRLGLGMTLSYVLPAYGNDTEVQHAGYIFRDAYNRDSRAWEMASSGTSLWTAFDKSTSIDQYGGLLFVSSLLYRFMSPDAHRQWLIILLAALAGAIGVVLAYKSAREIWGESVALGVGWIMALYPESILLGSSQMREPFLITCVAMMFWGLLVWTENRRTAVVWMASGLFGLLLFNPGIAVAAVVILAVWAWLDRKERHISWWIGTGILVAFVLAVGLFGWAVSGSMPNKGGFLATLINWIHFTTQFDSSVLVQNSGWVQTIFKQVPNAFHLPFIIGYGILQPVLPAAIGDVQAVWPIYTLGVLRGVGWFAMLPFLIYFPFSLGKITAKRERLAWLWLWMAMAVWIIISSARGGGDQWDNPRYRATLLIFQAALVAQVLCKRPVTLAHGLVRLLEVEAVFVVCFSAWTISRYDANPFLFSLSNTVVTFTVVSLLVLIGDWMWARYQGKKRKGQKSDLNG